MLILYILALAGTSSGGPVASRSLDQVAEAVNRNTGAIESILVRYSSWDAENADGDPALHGIIAAKGIRRYSKSWHHSAGSAANDPGAAECFYNGSEWNVFNRYGRHFQVSRRFAHPPYTDKITFHMYFEATAWWIASDPSTPLRTLDGGSFFLKDVLADSKYSVAESQENNGGVFCHVVERPGHDRLWVDVNRGVLLRRERFVGSPPRLEVSYALRDYREVRDGMWLPFEIEREHHIIGFHTIHRIDRYFINDVEDRQFEFTPPPGTYVHNRDNDTAYQVPGGLEFMEVLVDRARRSLRDQKSPMRIAIELTCALFAGVVAAIACSTLLRTRQKVFRLASRATRPKRGWGKKFVKSGSVDDESHYE